jgi:hypothetical protein
MNIIKFDLKFFWIEYEDNRMDIRNFMNNL